MINFPSKFKNLTYNKASFKQENNIISVNFDYEDEEGKKWVFSSKTAIREVDEVTIVEVGEEVNGFRRVLYSNGKVGFQNAETEEVLPYKFCIASDFNEYGYAMVGMVDGITWIDKAFNRLTSKGSWMPLDLGYPHAAIIQLTDFISGISTVISNKYSKKVSFFMDTKGNKVEFINGSDNRMVVTEREYFSNTPKFNDNGYFISSNGVFFADGRFMTFEEIVRLPETASVLASIGDGSIEVKPRSLESGKQMSMKPVKHQ